MPLPCHRCGATKTEPVRRGIVYQLARVLGYRLRECSRCRRWRILPEGVLKARAVYARGAEVNGPRPVGAPASFDPDGFDGCPRCGGMDFDRAPRNWLERMRQWAPMARCRTCRKRFTYPQH